MPSALPYPTVVTAVQADNGAAANGSSKRGAVASATAADAAAAAATPNWSAGATQIGPGLFLVPSAVPGARAWGDTFPGVSSQGSMLPRSAPACFRCGPWRARVS